MSDASTHGAGVGDEQEPAEGSRQTVDEELAESEGSRHTETESTHPAQ